MADRILAAAAIQRDLISGTGAQGDLNSLINRFAGASLYHRTPEVIGKLRRQIFRLLAKEYLPYARAIGSASAKPILDALGGEELVAKGATLRGPVLRGMKKFTKRNMMAFRAELNKELGTLSGEVEAGFARAYRDGVARKKLIGDLITSDRGELKRLAQVRREITQTGNKLKQAERKLFKASKRKAARAKRGVRDARKAHTKAKAKIRTTKSFYARFETKVQGHTRDAIKREGHRAEQAAFEEAGYGPSTIKVWITVNGSDSCPSCSARHGTEKKGSEWQGDGPGDGGTFCGESCDCHLTPKAYTEDNQSLIKPLRMR